MANEPGQLDRLTVLRSGGEVDATVDRLFRANKGKASIEAAKNLRKVQAASGKDTMRAGLAIKEGETKFNVRSVRDFRERFGAGKKGAVNSTPSEMASFTKADQTLRQNATIALFLELRSLTPAEQATMLGEAEVTEAVGGLNTLNSIKREALNLIARSDSVRGLFPELDTNGLDPAQKISFIESTLFPADDARFAARFGTRMREAYKKSVELPTVVTDEDRTSITQKRQLEELKFTQKAKAVTDFLNGRRIENPATGNPYTESQITDLIKNKALTPESAVDSIAFNLLGINNMSNVEFTQLKQYRIELPKSIATLGAQLEAARMALPLAKRGANLNAFLALNPTNPDVMQYRAQKAQFATLETKYTNPPNNPNLNTFNVRAKPFYDDPAVMATLAEAKQAQLTADELGMKLTLPSANLAEIQKSHDLRILQEEDLLGEMDGIIGQSILDVLEERYDVMEERMGRLMTEKAGKSEKDVKVNIMKLKKKMSENWIKYEMGGRKKKVDKAKIKNDVVHLTYSFDKEVAVKQLIARDVFDKADYAKINMVDGTNMDAPGTTILTSEQIKQVEEVFKQCGGEYRDKLFADMFAARTFGDKSINILGKDMGGGKLGFKRDEWQYMMQRYEPEITKGLETNKEASAAMKRLEAEGVKINFNLKWLMYLLTVVLGVGAGAVAIPHIAAAIPGIVAAIGGAGALPAVPAVVPGAPFTGAA